MNRKGIRVIYPDGFIQEFDTVRECADFFNDLANTVSARAERGCKDKEGRRYEYTDKIQDITRKKQGIVTLYPNGNKKYFNSVDDCASQLGYVPRTIYGFVQEGKADRFGRFYDYVTEEY